MTGKDLFYALTDIEDDYIMEAIDIQPRRRWPKWAAAAGIILLLVGFWADSMGYFSLGRSEAQLQNAATMDTDLQTDAPSQNQAAADEGLLISMEDVRFNELDPMQVDSARRFLNIEWAKTWSYNEVLAHYTPMLGDLYIPEGLKPAQTEDSIWTYYQKLDGEIIEDTVYFGYYHDYYEDGSPKLTEDVAAVKGVSVVASRTGIFSCCIYMEPEEVETYTFNGIQITFGKRTMPYGPYDLQTHTPSGYYDEYTAEFQMDGAWYEITTAQLDPIEIVRITASLTCGGKGYTVE